MLFLWTAIWGARVSTVVCPLGITSDHVIVPEEVLECRLFLQGQLKDYLKIIALVVGFIIIDT